MKEGSDWMKWGSWECHQIRQQLPLWVGGDLPEYDRHTLELHLQKCEACAERAGDLEDSRGVLQCAIDDEFQESESIWSGIADRLDDPIVSTRRERSFFRVGRLVSAAVVVVAIAGGIQFLPLGSSVPNSIVDQTRPSGPGYLLDPPTYVSFPNGPAVRHARPLNAHADQFRYNFNVGQAVGKTVEF